VEHVQQIDVTWQPSNRRWIGIGSMLLTTIVLLFPVQDDGVWWLLARGRQAVGGSLKPTAELLNAARHGEPDWLGGVLWWGAFQCLGTSGLMLLKLLLGTLTITVLLSGHWDERQSLKRCAVSTLTILMLLLIGARDAWDCHPSANDCVCAAIMIKVMNSATTQSIKRAAARVLLVSVLWANLGRLGLLSCLLASGISGHRDRRDDVLSSWLLIAASLFGGCMTPRGPMGLVDGCRQLWPFLFEGTGLLHATEWSPLWQQSMTLPIIAFMGLSCGAGISWMRTSFSAKSWPAWLLCVGWGCSVTSLLPVLNVVLAAQWLSALSSFPTEKLDSDDSQWQSCGDNNDRHRTKRFTQVSGAFVLALGCLICLSGWERRPGWGLDARLELGPVSQALSGITARGSVWCADLRAAGAIAWLSPSGLRVEDVAEHAWREGRWREYAALNSDLRRGWRDAHRRVDGSIGGWWLPLTQRRVELVVTSAEDAELIAALEPTVWKPLLLEGGVIPFAKAGDPGVTPQIMLMLRQREFVEQGPWRYSVADAQPESRVDFGELIGLRQDAEPTWRQARTLRAMNLHSAAMRVLDAGRATLVDRRLNDEWALCLVAQVHAEWLTTNTISDDKRRALTMATTMKLSSPVLEQVQNELNRPVEAAR